jgi:hypothetical protein
MSRISTAWFVLGFLASVLWTGSQSEQAAARSTPTLSRAPDVAAFPRPDAKVSQADKKPKPKFTISKETTYLTGPLDKDGYIDYATALNERLRQGVTVDNNANVLFWKAFGPLPEGKVIPTEFFQLLAMKRPPEKGEYFASFLWYAKEHLKLDLDKQSQELYDQMDRANLRPWIPKQLPHVAAWLTAIDKPLALIVEGTKRSHYFSPWVYLKQRDGKAGATDSHGNSQCRQAADALIMRAMQRIGHGRVDEAWQDLLACHRLGRLVALGGSYFDGLVGLTIDACATEADVVFLGSAKLDAKMIKDCRRDLEQLPSMPPLAEKVEFGLRFVWLDSIRIFDGRLKRFVLAAEIRDQLPEQLHAEIDWNVALRIVNRWHDDLVAALRVKDRDLRQMKLIMLEKDFKEMEESLVGGGGLKIALEGDKSSAQSRGRVIGYLLNRVSGRLVHSIQRSNDYHEQTQRNLHIAFALAQYQLDHGFYPKKLEALAPKYLAEIPLDLFTGKVVTYLPADNGYLLYSFGANGQDDGGRTWDDNPPGDDIRVRMPLPKLPGK